MFSRIGKRLTYANVAMTLALVFAMTGGAYAAKHYLITSTKQISPKVLKQLMGKNGQNGTPGAAGPQGPAGATGKDGANGGRGLQGEKGEKGDTGSQGPQGEPWTAGGTLPKGAVETGQWSIIRIAKGGGEIETSPISFTIPLATSLGETEVHFIEPGEGEGEAKPAAAITSGECTGTFAEPGAASGNLCVFASAFADAAAPIGPPFYPISNFEMSATYPNMVPGAGRSGAVVTLGSTGAGVEMAAGTWVVKG